MLSQLLSKPSVDVGVVDLANPVSGVSVEIELDREEAFGLWELCRRFKETVRGDVLFQVALQREVSVPVGSPGMDVEDLRQLSDAEALRQQLILIPVDPAEPDLALSPQRHRLELCKRAFTVDLVSD